MRHQSVRRGAVCYRCPPRAPPTVTDVYNAWRHVTTAGRRFPRPPHVVSVTAHTTRLNYVTLMRQHDARMIKSRRHCRHFTTDNACTCRSLITMLIIDFDTRDACLMSFLRAAATFSISPCSREELLMCAPGCCALCARVRDISRAKHAELIRHSLRFILIRPFATRHAAPRWNYVIIAAFDFIYATYA